MKGGRVSSFWILLSLAAPPCQETNPDFDGASGADTGLASSTAGTSSASADDGVVTTSSPTTTSAEGGSGSGSGTTAPVATGSGGDSTGSVLDGTSSGSGDSSGSSTGLGCTMCPDGCVDLMTDHDNCGECGNDCHPVQEICEMGMCVPD